MAALSLMNTAFIIVGLGYGDEGKGATVDAFTRKRLSDLTVRFNGGPQAGHNVVDENGKHHCFSQFGSGTLAGARTLLSKYMLVNPLNIFSEADRLLANFGIKAYDNLYVHEDCKIITPYHKAINRIRELLRGYNKHGSCGMGVGAAVEDYINNPKDILVAKDLKDEVTTYDKIRLIIERLNKELERYDLSHAFLQDVLQKVWNQDLELLTELYKCFTTTVEIIPEKQSKELINFAYNPVFEGAQGVLLDENWGFHPYTTWSTTTPKNALDLLNSAGWRGDIKKIGCTRTYFTRHGAGPFITEDPLMCMLMDDEYNPNNRWQNNIRSGFLDIPALKYATKACEGIDGLSISHLDSIEKYKRWKVCYSYCHKAGFWDLSNYKPNSLAEQQLITDTIKESSPVYREVHKEEIVEEIELATNSKIILKSVGPRYNNRVWI